MTADGLGRTELCKDALRSLCPSFCGDICPVPFASWAQTCLPQEIALGHRSRKPWGSVTCLMVAGSGKAQVDPRC